MPDTPETARNMLQWVESEIKKADNQLTKEEQTNIVNGLFARIRKLRFTKEIINEYLKTR